jgi:hypothetical protein
MSRTTIVTAAVLAALAATAAPTPATADDISYQNHVVESTPPDGAGESISLDVPADWERDTLNWHTAGFFDYIEQPRSIVVDLEPLVNTVREARAEARVLRELGRRYYREFAFKVNEPGSRVRARWVFAYRDAPTDDTWSYTGVFLMKGNRLVIDGRLAHKEELQQIRRHVVRSVEFLR